MRFKVRFIERLTTLTKQILLLDAGLRKTRNLNGWVQQLQLHTALEMTCSSFMVQAKQVVLSKGSLALALQATMSIPGVFAPVEIDGEVLASDGGLLNNIPTDVMV